uniref:NADH dehydrogenase subunit 6 n=1 Tax=Changeondelphax velitchkovskyi TaxID=1291384 RepID=A0A343UJB3_9HEMI|nr:NADH dehydrogenase subunit 6 [Changeondelphax velitchkovskyi]AVC55491.1 NADH dehydrogenase subunit 6 [Changeondelphax velitchkovskyi]
MKLIQMSLLLNTFISIWLNHPISLGTMLMIQSMTTGLFTILLTKNSWYSMILFITFSSGLMIMFMYMSSISSNEKFKWSMKIFIMLLILMIILFVTKMDTIFLFKNKWMEKKIFFQENEEKKTILKILTTKKVYLLISVTTLILLVLMSISNLINSFEGPLKKTYENFCLKFKY